MLPLTSVLSWQHDVTSPSHACQDAKFLRISTHRTRKAQKLHPWGAIDDDLLTLLRSSKSSHEICRLYNIWLKHYMGWKLKLIDLENNPNQVQELPAAWLYYAIPVFWCYFDRFSSNMDECVLTHCSVRESAKWQYLSACGVSLQATNYTRDELFVSTPSVSETPPKLDHVPGR